MLYAGHRARSQYSILRDLSSVLLKQYLASRQETHNFDAGGPQVTNEIQVEKIITQYIIIKVLTYGTVLYLQQTNY